MKHWKYVFLSDGFSYRPSGRPWQKWADGSLVVVGAGVVLGLGGKPAESETGG